MPNIAILPPGPGGPGGAQPPMTGLNLSAPGGGALNPYTGMFAPPGGSSPTAPTATSFGAFTAPDPANFQHSPSFGYDMDQMLRAVQRSAAARGTLLTPDTLKSLQSNAMGLASRDYQNAFTNALNVYNTNRDTNAQNFGQRHTVFGDELAGHQADFRNALDTFTTNRDTTAGNIDNGLKLGAFVANPPSGIVGGAGGGGLPVDYAQSVQTARSALQPGSRMERVFRPVNSGPADAARNRAVLSLYNQHYGG